ncbi:MAG TPA: YbhB/YbcL family Raf kinase inhibitor-like protein [Coleofasciculaceae cyanobacterium]
MPNPIGRRVFLRQSVNLLELTGLSLVSCNFVSDRSGLTQQQPTPASKTMKLESTAFIENGMIPFLYTCDGQDISPALSWNAPPTGTQSLALIVDDPDAPGQIFVHWVLYDLPPEIHQLPQGAGNEATLSDGGTQGRNDFGKLGYGGPCPPSGLHRYFFKLYALNRELGLKPGATKAQLEAAMSGHILAAGELIGRYARS